MEQTQMPSLIARRAAWRGVWLVVLVGFSLLAGVPLSAADTREDAAKDVGWGQKSAEQEEAAYQARIDYYAREQVRLNARGARLDKEMGALRAKYRKSYWPQRRLEGGSQAQKKWYSVAVRHEQTRYWAKSDYLKETRKAGVDPGDAARAAVWTAHLAYLRAERDFQEARLHLRHADIVTFDNLQGSRFLGTDPSELFDLVWDDVKYIAHDTVRNAFYNILEQCVAGAVAEALLTFAGKPVEPGAAAYQCLVGSATSTLADGVASIGKKNFIDGLVAGGVHFEVAEYWWRHYIAGERGFNPGDAGLSFIREVLVDLGAKGILEAEITALRAQVRERVKADLIRKGTAAAGTAAFKEVLAKATRKEAKRLAKARGALYFGQFLKNLGKGFVSVYISQDEKLTQKAVGGFARSIGRTPKLRAAQYVLVGDILVKIGGRLWVIAGGSDDWKRAGPGEIQRYFEIRECEEKKGDVPAEKMAGKILDILRYENKPYLDYRADCNPEIKMKLEADIAAADEAMIAAFSIVQDAAILAKDVAALSGDVTAHEGAVTAADGALSKAVDRARMACAGVGAVKADAKNAVNDLDGFHQTSIEQANLTCTRVIESDAATAAMKVRMTARSATERVRDISERLGRIRAAFEPQNSDVKAPSDTDMQPLEDKQQNLRQRFSDLDNRLGALPEQITTAMNGLQAATAALNKYFLGRVDPVREAVRNAYAELEALRPPSAETRSKLDNRLLDTRQAISTLLRAQDGLKDCPPPIGDPGPHVTEIETSLGASVELAAKTFEQSDRADICVAELGEDLKKWGEVADRARRLIAQCKFPEAKSEIEKIPAVTVLSQALGRLNNDKVEADARADTSRHRAAYAFRQGDLVSALDLLKWAQALDVCAETAEAIQALHTQVLASAVEHVGTLTTYCEFGQADTLLAALPAGTPQIPALRSKLDDAKKEEADNRQTMARASADWDARRLASALNAYSQVAARAHCIKTRDEAQAAVDLIERDDQGVLPQAKAVTEGCNLKAMADMRTELTGSTAPSLTVALARLVARHDSETKGAVTLARLKAAYAKGNLDAAVTAIDEIKALDPPPRCDGIRKTVATTPGKIVRLRRLRRDAKAAIAACDSKAMRKRASALAAATNGHLVGTRALLTAALDREGEAGRKVADAEGLIAGGGDETAIRRLLADATAETRCPVTRAKAEAALVRLEEAGQAKAKAARLEELGRAKAAAARAMAGCEPAAMRTQVAALAGYGEALDASAAEVLAKLRREVAAAEAYEAARQAYRSGKLDTSVGRLDTAALGTCPALVGKVERARARIARLRDAVARAEAVIDACDVDGMGPFQERLARANHRLLSDLAGTMANLLAASERFQSGRQAYAAGRLGDAKTLLRRAKAALGKVGGGRCGALAGRIDAGLKKTAKLRKVLARVDTAIADCNADDLDRLAATLAKRTHVLLARKRAEVQSARRSCGEKRLETLMAKAGLACPREFPGSVVSDVDAETGKWRCRCRGNNIWNRAGDACVTRDRRIAEGQAYCAREHDGVLVDITSEGGDVCCPRGYGLKGNKCQKLQVAKRQPKREPGGQTGGGYSLSDLFGGWMAVSVQDSDGKIRQSKPGFMQLWVRGDGTYDLLFDSKTINDVSGRWRYNRQRNRFDVVWSDGKTYFYGLEDFDGRSGVLRNLTTGSGTRWKRTTRRMQAEKESASERYCSTLNFGCLADVVKGCTPEQKAELRRCGLMR